MTSGPLDLVGFKRLRGDASTASPQNLKYEQLSSDFPEIRLLTLQDSVDEHSTIECTLERENLDNLPEYTALSYVWGDATVTENILVNGCVFPATTNLVDAFRHIRKLDGEIVLWVDAVCIDQSHLGERGQQVQLMHSIYSQAEKVIAWLGPDYDGGVEALRMLDRMMTAIDRAPNDFQWLKSIPELYEDEGENNSALKRWRGMAQFLERPYWSRVWILQEAALAQELLLMSGTERSTFNGTMNFPSVLVEARNRPKTHIDWVPLYITFMMVNNNWSNWLRIASFRSKMRGLPRTMDLSLSILILTAKLLATDPRDKIYGLLGMARSNIEPNYSKPASEVFTDIAKILLREEGIAVLAFATTSTQSSAIPGLPSCVPDWQLLSTSSIDSSTIHCDRYDAGGSVGLSGQPSLRGNFLFCSGLSFDSILRTQVDNHDFTDGLAAIHNIGAFMEKCQEYPTGLTKLQALIMTFHAGIAADYSKLEIKSQSWPAAAAAFIFYLVAKCQKAAPHLSVRESYNLVKSFMGLRLRGEAAEAALIDLCFRGSEHKVTISPFLNPGFEDYDFPIMAHLPILMMRQKLRLFYTERGYVGSYVPGMERGDMIAVIRGCRVPLVLRKQGSHFGIIGPCYVPGIMDGEAIEDAKGSFTSIEIH